MARREDIRKGMKLTADGGRVVSGREARLQRGTFMTVDAVVNRPVALEKQFPEFAQSIEAAGRPPTTADLARYWARQLELEQRLESLKARIKAVKRK